MKSPRAMLRELLGPLDRIVVLGVEFSLEDEVAIPLEINEELLFDNADRVAKWERIVTECRRVRDRKKDDLDEKEAVFHCGVWAELEARERKEMQDEHDDETELDQDAQDAKAGDKTWKTRRSQRRAVRVTSGLSAGRWRRNFSEALVQAQVNSQSEVITCKKALRTAKSQLDQAECVLKSVIHRSHCINHLCAMHRDNKRR